MNLHDRIDAVRKRMAAGRIDLLIAASSGLHSLDRPDPVCYLTDYRSIGESLFLLFQSGAAILIVSPAADADRVASRYTASASVATDDVFDAMQATLAGRQAAAASIATANIASLPYRLAQRIFSFDGSAARDFDDALYCLGECKTGDEIEHARKATAIAEKAFERLLETAHPGLPECELAVELNCYTESLGAEDNFLMLSASPHARAVTPSSARRIERGDVLLAELSPNFEGQFSQICRTVSIGTPRRELQEKYDLAVRAMWAGIEEIRPGIRASDVCHAIDRVFEAAGYVEYCRPPHMRRRGHGLGCGSVAPGDIAADNHTLLEEGMVFVVHPNQYIPEAGYLLCGEPVRVTATGVETLSKRTAELGVVDARRSGFAPCA